MKPFPFHPLTQTTVLDSSRKPSHGSQEKPLFCQIEHFQKWGVCVSLIKQVLPTGDPVSFPLFPPRATLFPPGASRRLPRSALCLSESGCLRSSCE